MRVSSQFSFIHVMLSGNMLETPAPSEKQYRAALLKNKFADIILKAREKTLPQVWFSLA